MPKEFSRIRRINEQIKRELADLIRTENADARFLMVSITSIDVTRDLALAKVYFTFLGQAEQRTEIMDALNQQAGYYRGVMGKSLHLRTVPKLSFIYDEVVERGAELSRLIDSAVQSDQQRQPQDDDGYT